MRKSSRMPHGMRLKCAARIGITDRDDGIQLPSCRRHNDGVRLLACRSICGSHVTESVDLVHSHVSPDGQRWVRIRRAARQSTGCAGAGSRWPCLLVRNHRQNNDLAQLQQVMHERWHADCFAICDRHAPGRFSRVDACSFWRVSPRACGIPGSAVGRKHAAQNQFQDVGSAISMAGAKPKGRQQ